MPNYEAPEIVELGDARKLTLGIPNLFLVDSCDCQKKSDGEIIAL